MKDYEILYKELKKLSFGNGAECPTSVFGKEYDSFSKFKGICSEKNCSICWDKNFEKWEGTILKNGVEI